MFSRWLFLICYAACFVPVLLGTYSVLSASLSSLPKLCATLPLILSAPTANNGGCSPGSLDLGESWVQVERQSESRKARGAGLAGGRGLSAPLLRLM